MCIIRWIVIYSVDSAIQRLNNRDLNLMTADYYIINNPAIHVLQDSVHHFLSLTVNSAQQNLLAGTAPSDIPEATITAY